MVRSIHKTNSIIAVVIVVLISVLAFSTANAANPQNVDLRVNIIESLTVSVTDPDTWAEGDLSNTIDSKATSNFLRNKVGVNAATNNGKGVKVYMYTLDNNLYNLAVATPTTATTIPTLSTDKTVENFDVNHWGYSLKYTTAGAGTVNPTGDTDAGITTATYSPVPESTDSVNIISTSSTGTGSQEIFFGAKANEDKASGTYAQTVYFVAVTGEINTDPDVPIDPSSNPNPVDDIAHYNTTTNATTYTTTTRTTGSPTDSSITGNTTTTTTQVGAGNITDTYANAYGVTSTSGNGTAVATALAVAAATSAASGFFFFILAKRRKDDDEEEEEEAQK